MGAGCSVPVNPGIDDPCVAGAFCNETVCECKTNVSVRGARTATGLEADSSGLMCGKTLRREKISFRSHGKKKKKKKCVFFLL